MNEEQFDEMYIQVESLTARQLAQLLESANSRLVGLANKQGCSIMAEAASLSWQAVEAVESSIENLERLQEMGRCI